jgi:TonB family protein
MLQLNPKPAVGSLENPGSDGSQPRRLQIALALLLVALAVTLIRDRQFWFGGGSDDSDILGPEVASQPVQQTSPAPSPSLAAQSPKKHATARTLVAPATTGLGTSDQAASDSGVVASTRTAAAPLDVEVIAGDAHRRVRPGSNATNVEIDHASSSLIFSKQSASPPSPATNAAQRERLATTIQPAQASLEANYPLLAQQMRVQGSVVLQALIGTDGVIQNIRVLSGPSILASAAQQAVRQWKFKPYLQDGQPVETQAKITVNFTIKVADNSPASQLGM